MKILKLHSVSSSGPCSGPCCPAAYSRSLFGVHTARVVASGRRTGDSRPAPPTRTQSKRRRGVQGAPTLPFIDLLLLGTRRNVGEGLDVHSRWGGSSRSLLSLARQPALQPLGPPGAAVINALVYGSGVMDVGGLA